MFSYYFTLVFTAEGRNNERSVCRRRKGGYFVLRKVLGYRCGLIKGMTKHFLKYILMHALVLGGPYKCMFLPKNV